MMPQKEVNEEIYQQADPAYGRYEGNQTSSAHQVSGQDVKEGPFGKVYPPLHNNANSLRFALAVIALGLVVLFGLLFIAVIGGPTAWASFAVACLATLFIAGIGMDKIR